MARKEKSLVDSFMVGLLQEAKEAVDNVTEPPPPKPLKKQSSSKHDHISIISPSHHQQNNIDDVSDNYQVPISNKADKYHDKSSPSHQHHITKKKDKKSSTIASPSLSLSKSQTKVWLWFKERGETGNFNKPQIVKDLNIPYITVRLSIKKLEQIGIINLSYDNCQKNYEYKLTDPGNLKLSDTSPESSPSYHHHNSTTSPSLNSSSRNINKPTTCDPPDIVQALDFNRVLPASVHEII